MGAPETLPDDDLADLVIAHIPGVTVTTDEEFRAAVQKGIASYKAGPIHDLETVEAMFQRIVDSTE